jgi:GNAT superfamily N-acetyltransferase
MLYEFSTCIAADIMLFEDHSVTRHRVPGALFRPRQAGDSVFRHRIEPVGDYVIELNGQVAATGGFMLHYNHPFADLYMEVSEAFRGRGLGGYLVQELKRECYLHGRVPAARCDIRNIASRKTLIKAGLRTCGFIATGKIPVDHL